MYSENFVEMFFEFLHEYSNDPKMLNTLKPFIEYGWGTIANSDGQTIESATAQLGFVQWMSENGASLDAIKAAINLMTE